MLDGLNFSRRPRLPVIQSAESAECGLACLAMIGCYHGHDLDLNGLRQRFPISTSGMTLRSLIDVADGLGLSARPVQTDLAALARLKVPAILHWDLNHFVVLRGFKGGGVEIHDPAVGRRICSIEETSARYTGIALELTPVGSFTPATARAPVRLSSLWSGLHGHHAAAVQIILLSLALQLTAFALPFQIQLVIDEGVMRADGELLTVLALGFGALVVLQATIELLRSWTLQVVGQTLAYQMVGNVVRHLLRLPADYFEKRHVGDVLSRVGSANSIQDILTRGVVAALIDGGMALIAVAILFIYSPPLASVVLAAVAITALISFVTFRPMRDRMEEQIVERAREQSHMMETVRAASIIKLMGREAQRESAWRNRWARVINSTVSVSKYTIGNTVAQTLIGGLQTVIVVYLGARAIIAGDGLSVGMLFAFLSFRQTFADRTNALINQISQFRSLGLHLERLGDIVGTPSEPPTAGEADLDVRGGLNLKGVGFRYGTADRHVLRDVSLSIEPGEFVAFTGRSGGGKTTLLKLLTGLLQPTEGEIRLDGRPATPGLWRSWRDRVGIVSQDDRLLSGSIADNIAFFDPDLDMARVKEAASAARVHEEIMAKPMQYLSLVGDMGSSLSGGQKQRVLLARALYRNPRVLILDEGTANLDQETENGIAELIARLPVTRIVVAHRPALLARADRVLTLSAQGVNEEPGFTPSAKAPSA
jgi:ATP-binding cassette subfamily B protein RaxB